MASKNRCSSVCWILALACAGCGDDDADGHELDDASSPRDAATSMDSGPRGGSGSSGADASSDASASATQSVTIRFKAKVGTADFACGMAYENQGSTGVTVEPTDFRFYVQDLALISADGSDVPVEIDARSPWQAPGVALLDFEDDSGACGGTPETNDRITGKVPPGDYVGVVFSNGVPQALNHADPTTQPAPLQVAALQWSWLTGYRFVKAELVQVLEDDAGAATIAGVGQMHAGAVACSGNPGAGTISCANSNRNAVRFADFDADDDVIVADLGAIFAESDLGQLTQCHGAGPACAPMYERLGVDPLTGDPMPTQQVYRVE